MDAAGQTGIVTFDDVMGYLSSRDRTTRRRETSGSAPRRGT